MSTNVKAHIDIIGYKALHQIKTHRGNYSFNVNISVDNHTMDVANFHQARMEAYRKFLIRAEELMNLNGIDYYEVQGNGSTWITPFLNGEAIEAPLDDFISFKQYVLERRFISMFNLMGDLLSSINDILKYSSTYDNFITNMERYINL